MEYGWIWVGIIVLAIILEVVSDQLVAIWFVPGAIVSIILDFCGVDIVWQVLTFLILSAIGIVVSQKFLRKMIVPSTKTNIDAIVGEKCVVTEKIDNFAGVGQAKVKGQIWSARGVDDESVYEVGDVLTIVAIEGVKLICKKNINKEN